MRPIRLLAPLLPATAVRAEWHEATTDHFRIYADLEEAPLRAYAERLERFDGSLRALQKMPREGSTANKLTIYALSSRAKVGSLFGKGGANVGGWYTPRVTGSVAFVPIPAAGANSGDPLAMTSNIILQHEYTHHYLFRTSASIYPAWFVEGYAELFSTARPEPDGSVLLGGAAGHRAYDLAAARDFTLARMLAGPPPRRDELGGLYAKGWLLTHYLLFDKARAGQLAAYLKAMGSGIAPMKAATDSFGDLGKLDAELRRYATGRTLPAVRVAADRIATGPVRLRLLDAPEQAMMDVHIRSTRGVGPDQAKALLPAARKIAARYPASAPVQAWLAEAEVDADNLAEAEAAAGRALAADPANVDALEQRARAGLAAAARAKPAEAKAAWGEARRRIVAANRADPNRPWPLLAYYGSFKPAGAAPTPAAVRGLARAIELAPEAGELRLVYARQLLVEARPADARTVLAPIAFSPHGGSAAEAAGKVIGLIDGGGKDDLVAAFDAAFADPKLDAPPPS